MILFYYKDFSLQKKRKFCKEKRKFCKENLEGGGALGGEERLIGDGVSQGNAQLAEDTFEIYGGNAQLAEDSFGIYGDWSNKAGLNVLYFKEKKSLLQRKVYGLPISPDNNHNVLLVHYVKRKGSNSKISMQRALEVKFDSWFSEVESNFRHLFKQVEDLTQKLDKNPVSSEAIKRILTPLTKPEGGTCGNYYSLLSISDPKIDKLPYSIKIFLESAFRNCEEFQEVEKIVDWENTVRNQVEFFFKPARVPLNHFNGVTTLLDMACMRDAINNLHGDANKINPVVNLEYLARVVFNAEGTLYPDSVVGTDPHTAMINGLGVAGWCMGGIEAEATMLGQPSRMVLPGVIGFELSDKLRNDVTTTDLGLNVTHRSTEHS